MRCGSKVAITNGERMSELDKFVDELRKQLNERWERFDETRPPSGALWEVLCAVEAARAEMGKEVKS